MTDRAHLYRVITDAQGNVRSDASLTVSVYQPGTTTLITDTLYTDNTSGTTRTNPFVTSTGVVDFYLDTPQRVDLKVDDGSRFTLYADVDVLEVGAGRNQMTVQHNYTVHSGAVAGASPYSWTQTQLWNTSSQATFDPYGNHPTFTFTDGTWTINVDGYYQFYWTFSILAHAGDELALLWEDGPSYAMTSTYVVPARVTSEMLDSNGGGLYQIGLTSPAFWCDAGYVTTPIIVSAGYGGTAPQMTNSGGYVVRVV